MTDFRCYRLAVIFLLRSILEIRGLYLSKNPSEDRTPSVSAHGLSRVMSDVLSVRSRMADIHSTRAMPSTHNLDSDIASGVGTDTENETLDTFNFMGVLYGNEADADSEHTVTSEGVSVAQRGWEEAA